MIDKDFKLQVGMKVKIRDDLIVGQKYNDTSFADQMESYKGKEVKIIEIWDAKKQYFYITSESGWRWTFTIEMIDCIISTEPDKRYSLNSLLEKCDMFCITKIPYSTILTFGNKTYQSLVPSGKCFYPHHDGTTSSYYYVEYSQLILDKDNNMSKKKWKLDEIPTNTYIHNFPSIKELNDLICFFKEKFQCSRDTYTSKHTEDPTLYIRNNGYLDIFSTCPKKTDKTIIDYSNIIIEDKKEKGKIKFKDLKYPCVITDVNNDTSKKEILAKKADFPSLASCDVEEIIFYSEGKYEGYCDEKGWCASQEEYKNYNNKPYCDYNFYKYDDIDFSEKKIKFIDEFGNIHEVSEDLRKQFKNETRAVDAFGSKLNRTFTIPKIKTISIRSKRIKKSFSVKEIDHITFKKGE